MKPIVCPNSLQTIRLNFEFNIQWLVFIAVTFLTIMNPILLTSFILAVGTKVET